MSFNKNNYKVVRNVISKELSYFLYTYICLKKKVFNIFSQTKFISKYTTYFGSTTDPQVPNNFYSHYSDIAMENLLNILRPILEKHTKLKLIETYSYVRLYVKGNVLKRHTDRDECQISATLNLGGDEWAIFLEPSGKINQKGKKVILKPGDLMIYKGCKVEHWREPFKGNQCGQVFLHYNDINSKLKESLKFDKRPFIGLPVEFKKVNIQFKK
jgi:hypothetical protein|tara:strand:- start:519 stop:1160 length:642 start_codon:yes stop_codon:yes gene_type:complete